MKSNKLLPPPRVAAIHDVSCVGRCATTVILPTLSACGVQCCPLPTALLSTHTGGFENFSFLDLTDELPKIMHHLQSIDISFDAVYAGFLGSAMQMDIVTAYVKACKAQNQNCLFWEDPVMGDDGMPYQTYTAEMCRKTASLVKLADGITPNVTEACILLGRQYQTSFTERESDILLSEPADICQGDILVTGVTHGEKIGVLYRDKAGKTGAYFADRDEKNYPGTGDILSSVVLGGKLKHMTLENAVRVAVDFISKASFFTTRLNTPVREGLAFEGLLCDITSAFTEE